MKLTPEIVRERIQSCVSAQEANWKLPDSVAQDFKDIPERNMSIIKGTYWDDAESLFSRPRIWSNQVLPKWQANRSVVSAGETEFYCEPLKPDSDDVSELAGKAITQLWANLEIDKELKKAAWDVGVYGFGVVECGWRFRRKYKGKTEVVEGGRGEPVVSDDAAEMNFDEYGTPYTSEVTVDVDAVSDDAGVWGNPVEDDPYVERFSPREFIVDRNTTNVDLSDCRSAFRVKYEYVDRLKSDSRLKHTAGIRGSVYTIDDDKLGADDITYSDDCAIAKIYDGYTWQYANGNEVLYHVIYSDEVDEMLLCEENAYVDDEGEPIFGKNPFIFRVLPGMVVDNDNFYQITPVAAVADLQIAYDESLDQMNNLRRKSVRQFLVDKQFIADPNIRAGLESGIDGLLIEVEGGVPDNAIMQVPYSTGSMDLYKTLDDLPQEIGRQLGTNEFQESQIPDKKMLATEVNALANQGNARSQQDIEDYDYFREDIGKCILMLVMKFGDRARYFNDTDAEGNVSWGSYKNTDLINGESFNASDVAFKVKINSSSTRGKNKDYMKQEQAQLLQILSPFMQMPNMMTGRPIVNAVTAVRNLLKAFEQDDIDSYVEPNPTPGEQPAQPGIPGTIPGQGMPPQPGMQGGGEQQAISDIANALSVLSQYPQEVVQQVTGMLMQNNSNPG